MSPAGAPPAAPPPPVAPAAPAAPPRLTITDHVELLARFVFVARQVARPGTGTVRIPAPGDTGAWAGVLNAVRVPGAETADGAALRGFGDRALAAWATLGPALGCGADASDVLLHAHFRRDLRRRLDGVPSAACPPAHAAVLLHAYHLYARQLTDPAGEKEAAAPPVPPDWTAPWAALLALRELLGGGAPWEAVLPQLGVAVQIGILRMVAGSELVRAGEPWLTWAAASGGHVPAALPFRLSARLQDDLALLQAFGVALVGDGGKLPRPRVFDVAAVARSEVVRFRSLDWPARGAPFAAALGRELEACARKLLAATITPRPAFYNAFLRWGRQRFVLDGRVHFRLSPVCLPVVAHAQNLLVSLTAPNDATAAAAVSETGAVVAAADLALGDVFLLHRVVDGLRAAFGRGLKRPDGAAAPWRDILPHLAAPVRDRVLALAARTPIARIAVPDLARELAARGVPWAGLPEFLDDPAGEPLREYAAAALTAAVRADAALLAEVARPVLERCLDTNTVGGAVLVGDVFAGLVPAAFDPCQELALPGRGGAKPDKAAEAAAVERFKSWVLELAKTGDPAPVTAAFHALLAGFLARKVALDRDPATAADPRVRLLNGHWRAVVDRTARGLADRPWPVRAQRLLRCFWLLLCRHLLVRADALPAGLGAGSKRFDDLPTLACKMVAQMWCARDSYLKRKDMKARSGGAVSGVGGAGDAAAEAAEFETVETLLNQVLRFEAVRLALAARGLIEKQAAGPGQPVKWVFIRDALRTYAAAEW